jgi:hypothetical protein
VSEHECRNIGPSRSEILNMTAGELLDLMAECDEEPADFNGCKPCFAYLVAQHREKPDDAELSALIKGVPL